MAVTRADVIAKGDVQGVGYRYFVRKAAWKNKFAGYAENLEDGTVKIICEGSENDIKNFLKFIDIKKPPIFVESIDVEFSKATGEFKGFRIIAGSLEEEMIEGFSTGASYFEVMFDKQDLLQNTVEKGFKEVKDEIHLLRDDFREVFMTEINELRGEMKELRQAVTRIEKGMAKGIV